MRTCEIIYGQESIHKYESAWNELFSSGVFEPSTSFYWTHAWLSHGLKQNDSFLLAVLSESGKITGILPLVIRTTRYLGIAIKRLAPVSEYYNTHGDILIAKKLFAELAKTLLAEIETSGQKWDRFEMSQILETNDIVHGLTSTALEDSYHLQIQKTEPSYFITLASAYDDYLAARSRNFRKILKKCEKKMMLEGPAEVRQYDDFQTLEDAYKQLLAIEEKSWKSSQGTAIVSLHHQKSFYRALCEAASKEGILHLHFLYSNGVPIAYNLGLIANNTYYYLKTSYDEKYKHLSPSTFLRAKLIEELILKGIKFLDFHAEPYDWQQHWTSELRWHHSIIIYNHTVKGRLFRIYTLLRSKLKSKRLPSNPANDHDPQDTQPEA